MGKFCGNIAFSTIDETRPGIYKKTVSTRKYYGDVLKLSRRMASSSELNDNFSISSQISIVVDPFLNDNFYSILYVEFMGAKWKVSNFDVQYPRIVMTLGGLYNA